MKILIWGGKSNTNVLLKMLSDIHPGKAQFSGIFDPYVKELSFKTNIKFFNKKKNLGDLIKKSTHFLLCIGGEHGYVRVKIGEKLKSLGLKPISLISKHSVIEDLKFQGSGIQIMPGAVINKFTHVGDNSIFNTNSSVDHECVIVDGVHIMGGATVAGRVHIGHFSSIGTNATILPDIKIGQNVYIGAGSVVTKNVKNNSVIVGVPGKFLKKFKPKVNLSILNTLSNFL